MRLTEKEEEKGIALKCGRCGNPILYFGNGIKTTCNECRYTVYVGISVITYDEYLLLIEDRVERIFEELEEMYDSAKRV